MDRKDVAPEAMVLMSTWTTYMQGISGLLSRLVSINRVKGVEEEAERGSREHRRVKCRMHDKVYGS